MGGGKGEGFSGTTIKDTGQNQGGGWRWGREVGSPGVGSRDGEKRHTTVFD